MKAKKAARHAAHIARLERAVIEADERRVMVADVVRAAEKRVLPERLRKQRGGWS